MCNVQPHHQLLREIWGEQLDWLWGPIRLGEVPMEAWHLLIRRFQRDFLNVIRGYSEMIPWSSRISKQVLMWAREFLVAPRGVYFLWDPRGGLLYIGASTDLIRRFQMRTRDTKDGWWSYASILFTYKPFALEGVLIAALCPPFNNQIPSIQRLKEFTYELRRDDGYRANFS